MTQAKSTRKKIVLKPKNYLCFLVIALALAIFAVLYYTGALRRSQARMLHQIAYSIILAASLNLIVGYLGELSLGHAGFMFVGAYVGCLAGNAMSATLPPLLSLIFSLFVGGAAAAVCGLIVGLPALRLKGDYLAIVTLAFGEIVRSVLSSEPLQGIFGGPLGLSVNTYGNSLFIVSFVVLLAVLFLLQNLIRSKHGRAITAIRDSEIAARACGINVIFYKLAVFVIAAFFAGVAGVLYGHGTTPVLPSEFSYNYSIQILVMVVLGGLGSFNGAIVAAALLTFVDVRLQVALPGRLSALRDIIYALILVSIVIVNNAPALKKFRDKFNFRTLGTFFLSLFAKIFRRKRDAESAEAEIVDHPADWSEIPTKIEMNEMLSLEPRREEENERDEGPGEEG